MVITRDAAGDIAECLLSASFCADALVVDSGSGDHTVETARRSGARVVPHAWLGFGPQKQFAVQEAVHDWVLCLDADERLSPELRESIRTLFARGEPPHAAYALARRNRFLGRWLSHGEGYPDWTTRLQLVRERLFPPAAYMRARSGTDSARTPLPILYLRRLWRGVPRWLER